MTILEKLLSIQMKLKAPKNQYNSFSKFYYRSCEDILEAVKPLCAEQKTVLILSDTVQEIGGRTYIVACASLYDLETIDKKYSVGYAREDENKKGMDAAQITGSCSSYARKYALNGLFCIDDSKVEPTADPDTGIHNQKNDKKDNAQQPAPKIGAQEVAELQALAKRKGAAIDKLIAYYKVAALHDMTTQQWSHAMNELGKRADVQ